jgi:predicted dehydrogenase
MVFTIEEALEMEKLAKASDKVFQVGYQHRYNPLYHKVYETVNGGYVGTITHIEAHWNRNGNWRRPVPDPQHERIINWRMYREFSGGLMAELSSHQVDLTDYILNSHVMKATGFGGIDFWKDGRETFDNIYVNFEYPNGIKASYHSITTNAKEGYQIKFFGTKASVLIRRENGADKGYIYPEPKAIEQIKEEVGADAISSATMQMLEAGDPIPIITGNEGVSDDEPTGAALTHFSKCVRGEAKPIANVEFGKKSAIAVVMANTAMREEKTQYWKEEWSV